MVCILLKLNEELKNGIMEEIMKITPPRSIPTRILK